VSQKTPQVDHIFPIKATINTLLSPNPDISWEIDHVKTIQSDYCEPLLLFQTINTACHGLLFAFHEVSGKQKELWRQGVPS